jgi:hypothetical protein
VTPPRVATLLMAVLVAIIASGVAPALGAPTSACPGVDKSASCGVSAQPGPGQFHGVIAVPGAAWVLAKSARSGTSSGCGDCVWSLALSCPDAVPTDADGDCVAAGQGEVCDAGQQLYRLLLTTAAVVDVDEGRLCVGGGVEPIAIGDIAQRNAERYLRNARPPNLIVTTQPRSATLAGLRTYFQARTPDSLRPATVSGDGITETTTMSPVSVVWRWADDAASAVLPVTATTNHTYQASGVTMITLTTRWAATYTVTYQGVTLGPYNAIGQLTATQALSLPVRTSSPTLVSR